MTHPMTMHQFQDNAAVEAVGDAVTVAPCLAAIQHSYEAAKACIVDPARPSPSPAGGREDLPETEAIDLRAGGLPAVPSRTPGTAAMSIAARSLAEQLVLEELRSPGAGGKPAPGRATAAPGRQGWWQSLRAALHPATPPRSTP